MTLLEAIKTYPLLTFCIVAAVALLAFDGLRKK